MPGKMARSGPQRQLDGLEYRELAGPSVLCLPAIQKIPNFHVSSGFIWGIPAKLRGPRGDVTSAVNIPLDIDRCRRTPLPFAAPQSKCGH